MPDQEDLMLEVIQQVYKERELMERRSSFMAQFFNDRMAARKSRNPQDAQEPVNMPINRTPTPGVF